MYMIDDFIRIFFPFEALSATSIDEVEDDGDDDEDDIDGSDEELLDCEDDSEPDEIIEMVNRKVNIGSAQQLLLFLWSVNQSN